MSASGQGGALGRIADLWDAIPVKGPMVALVAALGFVFAFSSGGSAAGDCQTTPLQHVYRPGRLAVVERCAKVTGTVVAWRREHDGDYHVSFRVDGDRGPDCAPAAKDCWTNELNARRQHGYTVVELVPLGWHIGLCKDQRLELVGTKVLDLQHGDHKTTGWIELHPPFAGKQIAAGTCAKPNPKSLAPATEEER